MLASKKIFIPLMVLPMIAACGSASGPGPHTNGLAFASAETAANFDEGVIEIGESVTTVLKSSRSAGLQPYNQTEAPLVITRLAENDYAITIGNNTLGFYSDPASPNVLISDINSGVSFTLNPYLEQVGIIDYVNPYHEGSAVYGHLTLPSQIPTEGTILYTGYASAHILTEDGAGVQTYSQEDWDVLLHAHFGDSTLSGYFDADGTHVDLTDGLIDGQEVSAGLSGPVGISGEMSGHFYGQDARGLGGDFDLTYAGGLVTGAWVAAID